MSTPQTTEPTNSPLLAAQDRFIGLWGDMASSWGVPRTMAEIHAMLFVTGGEFNTDEIMARLEISRGNASMTLRTLLEWGIVGRRHRRGDRRDYFWAEQDVWRLFATVLRARKRREIDPLLDALRSCSLDAVDGERSHEADSDEEASETRRHNDRIGRMIEMVEVLDLLSERMLGPNGPGSERVEALVRELSEAEA